MKSFESWYTEHLSGLDYRYTIIVDGKTHIVTPLEYFGREDLKKPLNDKRNYNHAFLGRTILAASREYYTSDSGIQNMFTYLLNDQRINGMKYFAPSGHGVLDFLSDTESDLKILRGSNRSGKTASAWLDVVCDLIPCDPTWPIFSEHGVPWREWQGPIDMGAASYTSQSLQRSVWKEIRKWIPDEELLEYGDTWNSGDGKGMKRRKADLNWNRPSIKLKCGSTITFHTYNQSGEATVGSVYKVFWFDEQPPEALFDEIAERLRTVMGRVIISATPHKVVGRPDTGAGHLMHKLEMGDFTKGFHITTYPIQVGDAPDWVYPDRSKEKAYEKHVLEPIRKKNVKAMREGRSRFFGEYHQTSGLVYDELDKSVHIIPDDAVPITEDMTKYRAVDDGSVNPTACLWFAVDHLANIIVYDEYYERDLSIDDHVSNIIRQSGNEREIDNTIAGQRHRDGFKRWVERQTTTQFAADVLDPRAYALKDRVSRKTIGWLYRASGLKVRPAGTKQKDDSIPLVKELLRVDPTRRHIVTGELGAPRLYIMARCVHLWHELMGYVWEAPKTRISDVNPKEKPREKDDHLCDCLRYAAQIPLRYKGAVRLSQSDEEPVPRKRKRNRRKPDRVTGY